MITVRGCPHCGAENLPHRNYCRLCGSSLQVRCPTCGFVNRCGDGFCGGCGASLIDASGAAVPGWSPGSLAAGPVPDGSLPWQHLVAAENRCATVVKADLSGFTAMSELLGDPEEVTVIMNQVFEELVGCVRRYQGHVDNYAGDMIITFFGAPAAIELGAERAVRVALEMRDEVVRLNERNISHGVDLGISTGVASGVGLWGAAGFDEGGRKTLSGEMGDWAALLEKYAERGTVSFCPVTHPQVISSIPAEVQDQVIHRPGDDTDLPLYFAGDPLPPPAWFDGATEQAGTLPLCGRDDLLDQLVGAWANALGGSGGAIVLHGEAGVGKTRLLWEVARVVRQGGSPVYAVAGHPLFESSGDDWLEALGRAILAGAGIEPGDTAARETWLDALGLPPEADDPVGWLNSVAQQQPCLVVLDGIDWLVGEPVGELVAALHGSRTLVLMASRRTALVRDWSLPEGAYSCLAVSPLPPEEAASMVADLVPDVVSAGWVSRWAGGNPRHLVEYARCASDGVPGDGFVPPWRLLELAAVSLDELPESDRAVIYAASVAADDELLFDPQDVARVVAGLDVEAALARAAAAGLVATAEDGLRCFRYRTVHYCAQSRLVQSVRDDLLTALRGSEA